MKCESPRNCLFGLWTKFYQKHGWFIRNVHQTYHQKHDGWFTFQYFNIPSSKLTVWPWQSSGLEDEFLKNCDFQGQAVKVYQRVNQILTSPAIASHHHMGSPTSLKSWHNFDRFDPAEAGQGPASPSSRRSSSSPDEPFGAQPERVWDLSSGYVKIAIENDHL